VVTGAGERVKQLLETEKGKRGDGVKYEGGPIGVVLSKSRKAYEEGEKIGS